VRKKTKITVKIDKVRAVKKASRLEFGTNRRSKVFKDRKKETSRKACRDSGSEE